MKSEVEWTTQGNLWVGKQQEETPASSFSSIRTGVDENGLPVLEARYHNSKLRQISLTGTLVHAEHIAEKPVVYDRRISREEIPPFPQLPPPGELTSLPTMYTMWSPFGGFRYRDFEQSNPTFNRWVQETDKHVPEVTPDTSNLEIITGDMLRKRSKEAGGIIGIRIELGEEGKIFDYPVDLIKMIVKNPQRKTVTIAWIDEMQEAVVRDIFDISKIKETTYSSESSNTKA